MHLYICKGKKSSIADTTLFTEYNCLDKDAISFILFTIGSFRGRGIKLLNFCNTCTSYRPISHQTVLCCEHTP